MAAKIVATSANLGKEVAVLFEKAEAQREVAKEAMALAQEIYERISALTSPYHVGQVIETSKGLGVNGLLVDRIVAPVIPNITNRWAIETFSYSKAGEITRRGVYIDERLAADPAMAVSLRK